jgi:hypothetical protein
VGAPETRPPLAFFIAIQKRCCSLDCSLAMTASMPVMAASVSDEAVQTAIRLLDCLAFGSQSRQRTGPGAHAPPVNRSETIDRANIVAQRGRRAAGRPGFFVQELFD